MKKNTLLFSFSIFAILLKAQSFNVVYTFDSVKTTSGQTDPSFVPTATGVTFGSFIAVGTPANPATGTLARFNFTNWPTGSTNGDVSLTQMTGVFDTAEYYEVTLSPAAGYLLSLDTIRFSFRRSGTGVRTYAVRSSADGFTNNLNASIMGTDTMINVQAGNVFFLKSDNTNNHNGSTVIISGAGFSNLQTPIRFRFYAWNAEASSGTFSIDNVRIFGSALSLAPAITAQPQDLTVCVNSPAMFGIAATDVVSYQWQENTGSGFVALSNAGNYTGVDTDTLRISNSSGLSGYQYICVLTNADGSTTSDTVTLTESIPVTPSVTIPSSLTICEGIAISGAAVGTNAGAAPFYVWYVAGVGPVATGDSLQISAGVIPSGTYIVYCELTSSAGCTTVQTVTSNTLTIVVNPAPPNPVIGENLNELYTSQYTTYQWYYGTTALGTDSSQIVTQSGIYTVVVTNADGCSTVSADYNFVFTSNNGIQSKSNNVNVFPNPSSSGLFTLDLGNTQSKSIITVYNVIGKVILSKEITSAGKSFIDLSSEANGIYFVSVKNDKENSTHKITITK